MLSLRGVTRVHSEETAGRRRALQGPPPDPISYCPKVQTPASGNRVEVLQDGREAFPAMLEAIAAAARSVHLEMYIFSDDATGQAFAEALGEAARRGVEVVLLYDSLGCWRTHPWIFDWMRGHGVKVLAYRPIYPWRKGWGWGRRDHRKILVVDGRIGFTGGINIDDCWAERSAGGRGWRDTMVRIEGPAALELDRLFVETWEGEARRQKRELPIRPCPPRAEISWRERRRLHLTGGEGGGVPVAIVGNRAYARRRAIRKAYRYAIARARDRILIANPYFVPDHAILRSLKRALRRGVHVSLLLPGTSDVASVQWASRAVYERLLEGGVEIYQWCKPVFHAKTAVIDGVWCTVGTYNLDTQSLRYNLEVTAVIPDPGVASQLERILLGDMAQCTRVDLAGWRKRPFWWRIPERFFYFFRAWL